MTATEQLHEPWPDLDRQREGYRLGMWLFLASEVLLFGGLFATYVIQRYRFPVEFALAARETAPAYGVANTAILLLSSCAVASAERLTEAGRRRAAGAGLWIACVLGVAFLVVKGFEYADDLSRGLLPGPSFVGTPIEMSFWAFYWTATGMHAIHLVIGVGLLGRVAWRRIPTPSLRARALYWHFVDVVWIFLFPALYLVGRG